MFCFNVQSVLEVVYRFHASALTALGRVLHHIRSVPVAASNLDAVVHQVDESGTRDAASHLTSAPVYAEHNDRNHFNQSA